MSDTSEDVEDGAATRAGEYVLGTLDPGERAAVTRAAEIDPVLAREIADWHNRLHPLLRALTPVDPPEFVWARIQRDVGRDGGVVSSLANGHAPAPRGGSGRVGGWRFATFGAMALAAGFAAFAFLRPAPQLPSPLAAAIVGNGGGFLAQVLPNGAILLRPAGKISVPDGKDLQLWALADGQNAPASLGVLPAGGVDLGKMKVSPDTKLLISLEPKGGSPTGLPTGPVEFAGVLARPSGTTQQ